MIEAITLRLDRAGKEPGLIEGFQFFWAFYVTGFDQRSHCQPCFKGTLSPQVNSRTVRSGQLYRMDERRAFRYLYVCGVGTGPKNELHRKNFHLGLRLEPGAGELKKATYNGYELTVNNAVEMPIPEAAPDAVQRCKNFLFGMAYFDV